MNHPTRNVAQLAVAATCGALLAAGGGYALASSSTTTIHGCVNKKTHQLFVQKRCTRDQTRLVWSQQGPQGPQGSQGPQGPPDASAWAVIGTNPAGASVAFGRNITVQRIGVGEYQVTAGGPCATTVGAIEVNPEAPQY